MVGHGLEQCLRRLRQSSEVAHAALYDRFAQADWLRGVLAANQHIRCIMAVFHEPRFATKQRWGQVVHGDLWNVMDNEGAARGVDLVLSAHNHVYERLKPMIFNGTIDHRRGIWSNIVGTGGRDLIPSGDRGIRPGPRPTTTTSGSSSWCCAVTAGRSPSSAPTAPVRHHSVRLQPVGNLGQPPWTPSPSPGRRD